MIKEDLTVTEGPCPKEFTGIVYQCEWNEYWHIEDGDIHKHLGPAVYNCLGEPIEYFLGGYQFTYKEYWTEMFDIYKNTEHEELVLAHLLTCDTLAIDG